MIVPVILAGGSGSRLWPLSRSAYPKQLLPLVSPQTMLQDTVARALSIPNIAPPLVLCNQEHRFLVEEQLKNIHITNATIILEHIGKNTAPAAAIAALYLKKNMPEDPLLMILPADHVIKSVDRFKEAISLAVKNTQNGKLVTFGIKPNLPETGYGYIKTAADKNQNGGYDVLEFIEKPNLQTAQTYLASGQYYWNSGMFMFRASTFIQELEKYAPKLLKACELAVLSLTKDLNFYRLDKVSFDSCPSNSIDYAVMEKTQNAVLVPLNTAWSDVGSWSALWEVQDPDEEGNVVFGDVITDHVTNSYLRSESRMLAVVGVDNHIVIETPDAVLVAHKENTQAVKDMVNRLKELHRPETDLHTTVYRPWGKYQIVDKGEFFQVKRITVKPGASLSLQMHAHRSEHWIVVSGIAKVTRGEETFQIEANQSTYIPQGVKHRLGNPGKENLEMIEVQSGHYLGEDDIIRFEDTYGRVSS
jgi:mannose-1-phosphate guanylyltransferase/mannose-6-phosphate isomerase